MDRVAEDRHQGSTRKQCKFNYWATTKFNSQCN